VPGIFTSLIQSHLGGGHHGNFEVVVRIGDGLWHYWRDNTNEAREWKPGKCVCQGAVAGAGSMLQSIFGEGGHGNFEVLVPLRVGAEQTRLFHFIHFNDDLDSDWERSPHPVTGRGDHVVWPASMIQSDFGDADRGNFEVVVPLMGPDGHVELWHFFHDNANLDTEWIKAKRITGAAEAVAGPGSIIQANYGIGDHGNFEVVVPILGPGGRPELWHYFHDNSDVDSEWVKAQRVTGPSDWVAGGGVILESDFGDGDPGNLEVVVPLRMPHGHTELWHFWRDTDVSTRWQRSQMITASASGWASFIRSDFGPDEHRNFEVLVEECQQSIVHYGRNNERDENPWLRSKPIIVPPRLVGEQPIAWLAGTRKISQMTGEFDRQGWGGPGSGDPTWAHNRTESRWGIRGTDLGSSFVHKERIYFLFGDTRRRPQHPEDLNLDSIAFCTDRNPDDGLDLTFFKQPPLIRDGAVSQGGFEVPLDGVSFGGAMFVFFATDHFSVAGADQMGRSVVTRSDNDGYDFSYLWEFSRRKFVNVSLELAPGDRLGLPDFGTALLIWGSGRYRSSDVYLAAMPQEEVASGRLVHYYAGDSDGQPVWVTDEEQAVPLFCAGCVGELSVRWNPVVHRWIVLYNSDNPRGIVMRSAHQPWGPWTGPVLAFDPWRNGGYGVFMHIPWNVPGSPHDFVHDDMFGSWRENAWGGEYGPYQIAPLTRGEQDHTSDIFFTMSTWNPYQVMLMTTTVRVGGPELPV
jgi:Domain of unknown function (DUF4185)